MTLDLAAPPDATPSPDGLGIRDATDAATIAAVADVAVGSVGWDAGGPNPYQATFVRLAMAPAPTWRMFGGWVDGTLVAASALYTGAGNAGIYAVATAEAFRGRGIGRALTTAAIDAGRAAGLTQAVLMASEMGAPVYRRLGFRDVGVVRFLRWPGGHRADQSGHPVP